LAKEEGPGRWHGYTSSSQISGTKEAEEMPQDGQPFSLADKG
jgi:hypothetical protein